MKTLLSLLLPIGFAALMALPFNIEIAGSVLFSAGFLFLMRADYARKPRHLTSRQPARKTTTNEPLRLAA